MDLLGSPWDARNVVLRKEFYGFRKNHFSQTNQILERKSEILGPEKETKSDKKRIKKSIIFRMRFFSENDPKNDEDLKNYNNQKKCMIEILSLDLTKHLLIIDLSHWRLSSTDDVRYVSENNLQQILLSLVGYQQKARRLFSS